MNSPAFLWRSQTSFVLMAVGATLSLKDFLTFPVLAGQNGGGAFLLLYVFFLITLGLPLLMSEIMLGRISRQNPVSAIENLAKEHGASIHWKSIGGLALIAGFLILSSYSVIAGWSISYLFKMGFGVYVGATADGANNLFDLFRTDTERMMLWHTMFVLLFVAISAQGIRLGVEKIFFIIVPAMVVLLVIGLVYAVYSQGIEESLAFLFNVDFSKIDAEVPILALQRAFYTLALGVGVMMIYGSYLPDNISIARAATLVISIDLIFSICTGLAINALVFTAELTPVQDNELAFRVLPVVFGQFEYGHIFGALFYLLLTIAALTTSIALLEGVISWVMSKYQYTRLRAVIYTGIGVWFLGLGSVLSYSIWRDSGFTLALYFKDDAYRIINQANFQDGLIFISSHLIQPLVALFICLFAAWVIPRKVSFKGLNLKNRKMYEAWNFAVRYVTPMLIFIVLISTLGLLRL